MIKTTFAVGRFRVRPAGYTAPIGGTPVPTGTSLGVNAPTPLSN